MRRVHPASASASASQELKEMQREIKLLQSVEHPHLLPLLGYCLSPEALCLAFPLMRGGSLEDRLRPQQANSRGRWTTLPRRPVPPPNHKSNPKPHPDPDAGPGGRGCFGCLRRRGHSRGGSGCARPSKLSTRSSTCTRRAQRSRVFCTATSRRPTSCSTSGCTRTSPTPALRRSRVAQAMTAPTAQGWTRPACARVP